MTAAWYIWNGHTFVGHILCSLNWRTGSVVPPFCCVPRTITAVCHYPAAGSTASTFGVEMSTVERVDYENTRTHVRTHANIQPSIIRRVETRQHCPATGVTGWRAAGKNKYILSRQRRRLTFYPVLLPATTFRYFRLSLCLSAHI